MSLLVCQCCVGVFRHSALVLCPPSSLVPPTTHCGVVQFDGIGDKGVFQSVSATSQKQRPEQASLVADDNVFECLKKFSLHINHTLLVDKCPCCRSNNDLSYHIIIAGTCRCCINCHRSFVCNSSRLRMSTV